MESSHQNKILHWCRNVWVYHVLNFVNANSSQILKGPKPGTPHVINVHGFTLNKIYQKQKQSKTVDTICQQLQMKHELVPWNWLHRTFTAQFYVD